MPRFASIVLGCCLVAAGASADRVHLVSGSVIEGRAKREGDKVVVEVDSGEVALPADSVASIESSMSELQRVDAMLAKLKPGDSAGLLKLADYCRDHQLPAREQELLQRILETAPDHAEARARLGYVRGDGGWVKREDQMRAQGMVEYQGRWVTREQMLELERIQAQTDTAAHERDKAAAEAKKAEADARRAQEQANTAQAGAQQPPPPGYGYAAPNTYTYAAPYTYATPYTYASPHAYASPRAYAPAASYDYGISRCASIGGGTSPACNTRSAAPPPYRSSFPIAGVKDPFDYFR